MAGLLEIQAGRIGRFLQKFTGIKGTVRMDLANELQSQLSLQSGVENRYLEGWNRFAVNAFIAGAATFNGKVRLRNPPTSNVIAVFERIVCSAVAAVDQPLLDQINTTLDLASVISIPRSRMDSRGNPQPTLILSQENTTAGAGSGTLNWSLSSALNTNAEVEFVKHGDQEIPVLPGDCIQLRANVVNNAFTASYIWRERSLEESETK